MLTTNSDDLVSVHKVVCGADVYNIVRSAWNSWRGLSGVICDKKAPVKLKNKLYKTVIRPTLIYGSECWALHRAEQQRNRYEDDNMNSGQNKERPNQK